MSKKGELKFDAQKFLDDASAIADASPRGVLTLNRFQKKLLPALLATPIDRFSGLILPIEKYPLDDATIETLVTSPKVAGFEQLDLGSTKFREIWPSPSARSGYSKQFGDAAFRALSQSPHVSKLRRLQAFPLLSTSDYGPIENFTADGLASLLTSSRLKNLRELLTVCSNFGVGAAIAKTTVPIETLTLLVENFDDADATQIAKAKTLGKLTHLKIVQIYGGDLELTKKATAALRAKILRVDLPSE